MKDNIQVQKSSVVISVVFYISYVLLLLERQLFDLPSFGMREVLFIFFNQLGLYLVIGTFVAFNEIIVPKNKIYKYLLLIIVSLNFLLLIIEQVFYKILHAPISLSFSEGLAFSDLGLFLDSGLSEFNYSLIICVLLLTLGLFFISSSYVKMTKVKVHKLNFIVIIFLFIISVPLSLMTSKKSIAQYPPMRLLSDLFKPEVKKHTLSTNEYKNEEIESLIYGKSTNNRLPDGEIYQKSFQGSKKNIILFIIESVGSMQIAPEGKLDPRITPYLFKYQKEITLFNSLYNIFPGTTRSHIPISTGGKSMTWSSVNRELLFKYKGVTLPSFFNENEYQTALFSGMNLGFENLNFFYKNIGFDYVFDPDDEDSSFKDKYKVHSWGVDEKIVFSKALDLIRKETKPTYLQILTNTTHHPYGVPKTFKSKLPGDTKFQRYQQSLNYTDYQIGQFLYGLKRLGKLKDSLIFITGDHGQAFARNHEGNWTHKNFLYEENIKNFLIILDPNKDTGFSLSSIRGSIGDIFPTISKFISDKKIDTLGQNLMSDNYKQKLIFFHKNAHPELWGLVDGSYKFIASRMNEERPKLFDLDSDPYEKNNIINDHKNKIDVYTKKIKSWYLKLNNTFTDQLENFKDKPLLSLNDLSTYGPKKMTIGVNLLGEEFKYLENIHPNEDMNIWTQGVSYPVDTSIRYEFVSPSNKIRTFSFKYKKGWSSVKVYHRARKPMEEGDWTLKLYFRNENILTSHFNVTKKARLYLDLFKKDGGINYLSFGSRKSDNEFVRLNEFNPNEDMEVQLLLSSYTANKKLKFTWISPSEIKRSFNFIIKKGWTKSWVYHSPQAPMEVGIWTLLIHDEDQKELTRKTFTVTKGALLLKPDKY